jgi:hypothetical protein
MTQVYALQVDAWRVHVVLHKRGPGVTSSSGVFKAALAAFDPLKIMASTAKNRLVPLKSRLAPQHWLAMTRAKARNTSHMYRACSEAPRKPGGWWNGYGVAGVMGALRISRDGDESYNSCEYEVGESSDQRGRP